MTACVLLSDASHVRRLNAEFRGKDKATNVLSFPASRAGATNSDEPASLGDIVLALDVVAQEAREQGVPVAHHLQHLVIHGLLHLLGFDHETGGDAGRMEELEIEILADLGIPDPYSAVSDGVNQPIRRQSA
jgi:probable rRNA maturation factor